MKAPAERVVKDFRRQTRRHFSAEDKIRIVLDGLRGEDSIAQSLYYTWSKEFMEAGKRRLAGDTARAATTGEVQDPGISVRRPLDTQSDVVICRLPTVGRACSELGGTDRLNHGPHRPVRT